MLQTIDLILISLMVTAAAWTFRIKYEAEAMTEHIAKLEMQLQEERDAIDILQADWSLLSKPSRLQVLVERYKEELQLVPLEATQIGDVKQLPIRYIEIQPSSFSAPLGGYVENGTVKSNFGVVR